ncbi:helix-turn-helix transcriptional regulator [Streptomyces sp. NPDC007346]|uniref:helix-turn-helix domain-containing protein n=1 Tax=Streptomyces sp. NPDC007346 TaxID=3154682 RepID=UPI0034528739
MTFQPEQLSRSKTVLATSLRELRKRVGLSQVRLAQRCNMSQTKLSNIETGRVGPSLVDVELILKVLKASPAEAAEVMSLARLANTEWESKRASWRKGVEKRQAELAGLESEATVLRYFLPAMVTGLLATPEYVKASLSGSPGDKTVTIARKLERQAILYDTTKAFTFLLTEQAVRWPVLQGAAMAVQVDRLVSLSHLPNVRIGVLPLGSTISRGPMNTFTVYDERLATAETFTGRMVFQDSRDITEHLSVFDAYGSQALFDEDARHLLTEWAIAFRS